MKTLLSTHFNITNDKSARRFQQNMTDPDWFKHRFRVSEDTLIASIDNQTVEADERFVVVAENIDQSIKDDIEDFYGSHGFLMEEHGSKYPEEQLTPYKYMADNIEDEWVLLVTVSTDDMIIEDAIERYHQVKKERAKIVMWEGGYFWGLEDGKLARQSNRISESQCRMYPPDVLDSVESIADYSQKSGPAKFWRPGVHYHKTKRVHRIDDYGFLQSIHGNTDQDGRNIRRGNDSTAWTKDATDARIEEFIEDEQEKKRILQRFGASV